MKINVRLNSKDISTAINQVEQYKVDLMAKLELFVSELADIGIKVAKANTYVEYDERNVNMGDLIEFTKEMSGVDGVTSCTLIAEGHEYTKEWTGGFAKVNPLLMAEFGSGARAIDGHRGTFPNQTMAFLSSWKWTDNSGQVHESSGNEPSRPLYKAKIEMESQIREVAERVFST